MIDKSVTELIEKAERRLDKAIYKKPWHKPRIWDANFVIAITFALIAMAKALEDIRKEIRGINKAD